jgi:hypothetical protein
MVYRGFLMHRYLQNPVPKLQPIFPTFLCYNASYQKKVVAFRVGIAALGVAFIFNAMV